MQILEEEIQLREETRGTEKARPALKTEEFAKQAGALAETQEELADRTRKVIAKIRKLPEPVLNFGKEIALLTRVARVMDEARDILVSPDTGPEAIAAETEAIELLLQAKRVKPGGGGGGGSTPGGGGGSEIAENAALALIGAGDDANASIAKRTVGQATGKAGRKIPEEFRTGLDTYFNSVDTDEPADPGRGK